MQYGQFHRRARPRRPGSTLDGGTGNRLVAVALSACLVLLAGLAPVTSSEANAPPADVAASVPKVIQPMPAPRHPREKTYMKRKWGVEILFMRETVGGHMLEFRYKVIDPVKAAGLFVRKTKPVLIHVPTGIHLGVPTPAKTGPLRNSDVPLANHVYWMFFANPNRLVKAGDRVNLQIGEFAVEGLVVI